MEGEVLVFANLFLAVLMCHRFMFDACHFLFLFSTILSDLTQSTLKSVGFGAGLSWAQCVETLRILIKHEIFSQAGEAVPNFDLPQHYFH